MSGMSWPMSKPLLTDDEFSTVLAEDNDASIWLALVDAAQTDPILSRVFALARAKGWSRFRTVMVCSYVMAQRHEEFIQREMDRLNREIPKMYLCTGCSKELTIQDPETREWRFKTPKERKAQ